MLTTMDVLTWCRHKNVVGLNQSICISQPSLLVSESPSNSNTDINKQFIKKNKKKNTKIRLHMKIRCYLITDTYENTMLFNS
jgi:hypothetical protein